MNKRVYITTAIPYVNASPHVGHALEFVQADCIARFWRATDADVYFASGSDENSLKNVQAAEAEGIDTQELVDRYARQFSDLLGTLNVSVDVFNRTSDATHFKGAQKLWGLCRPEDIYKRKYRGLYCVACEQFYTEDELVDGKDPEHGLVPEVVEEENYFFKLSNYQDFLYKLIDSDKLRIVPNTRKNEVLSFIKSGLADFSISRSRERARGWGVPVPGDESQVMYVWFDALTTYLTALGFGTSDDLYKKFWEDSITRVHVIGKGIIRFHAVYWIAMLESAGIKLPTDEFVHGYVTVGSQKISKTLGNVVDPFLLVRDFGVDAVRFYLLREIPAWGDGDFSLQRFKELYNGELANGLGNLVARVARLCADVNLNIKLKEKIAFKKDVADNLKNFRFDHAILAIWDEISALDKKINEEKPWELEGSALKKVIEPIAREVRDIGYNLEPFLPETSKKIVDAFTGKVEVQKSMFPRI